MRYVLLTLALLMMLTACEESRPESAEKTRETIEFRIALRSQLPQEGEQVGSGDYATVNRHVMPVTLGEPARVVSIVDGLTMEARWNDARRESGGNPERDYLVLEGFRYRLHNELVAGDTRRTYGPSAPEDRHLTTTWDHLVTPVALRPSTDDPRAICLQVRQGRASGLPAEPYHLVPEPSEP
jgi:hypothetical protein